MSIAWPDSIEDHVQTALDDALHAVFEQTVPNPHERGDLPVAQSADVERTHDGQYLVRVPWPDSLQAYSDATDAGDNYLDADGHADNPGMVVYDTLRDHGIPVPENDPHTGVLFDRKSDTVEIQLLVKPDEVEGGDA